MSYQSPIEIIYGNLKLETENAIVRAVQQVGINVDIEELRKALVYDRHMYERGHRDRDSEIIRCKDCKYGEKTKNAFGEDMIACQNSGIEIEYLRFPDWFCADAVHKEKENEK